MENSNYSGLIFLLSILSFAGYQWWGYKQRNNIYIPPVVTQTTYIQPSSGIPISDEAYSKVKDNMTLLEVEQILGKGKLISEGESSGYVSTVYTWEWNIGNEYHSVIVTFLNGKSNGKSRG